MEYAPPHILLWWIPYRIFHCQSDMISKTMTNWYLCKAHSTALGLEYGISKPYETSFN